jgi:hypothetical protein
MARDEVITDWVHCASRVEGHYRCPYPYIFVEDASAMSSGFLGNLCVILRDDLQLTV